jgi:hypothetical protein
MPGGAAGGAVGFDGPGDRLVDEGEIDADVGELAGHVPQGDDGADGGADGGGVPAPGGAQRGHTGPALADRVLGHAAQLLPSWRVG